MCLPTTVGQLSLSPNSNSALMGVTPLLLSLSLTPLLGGESESEG